MSKALKLAIFAMLMLDMFLVSRIRFFSHNSNKGLEGVVKSRFKKKPIYVKICECESGFKQFGKDGKVYRGIKDHDDWGLFQINVRIDRGYHARMAKKLHCDLRTVEGNIKYAEYLDSHGGPHRWWFKSEDCWNPAYSKVNKSLIASRN